MTEITQREGKTPGKSAIDKMQEEDMGSTSGMSGSKKAQPKGNNPGISTADEMQKKDIGPTSDPTFNSRTWYKSTLFERLCITPVICIITYWLIIVYSGTITPDIKKIERAMGRLDSIDKVVLMMQNKQLEDRSFYKEELRKYQEDRRNVETDYKTVTSKVDHIETDIAAKAEKQDLKDMSFHFEDALKKVESNFIGKLNEAQTMMSEKMKEFSKFIENFEKEFDDTRNSFKAFGEETSEKIKSFKDELSFITKKADMDLKGALANLNEQLDAITKAKEEADKILDGIKSDVDRIFPNTFNKEALTTAFLVLTVFVFLLAFWIYRVQARLAAGGLGLNQSKSASDVLQHIPRRVSLSNSLCIISFDEARKAAHEALVTSALQTDGNVTMEYFVVRRHEHLLRLPRCKFYIMCTEFSERHVIIEEPGLGLGDLKRCTYEAVQRYGAQMIILYTRDPGSKNLGVQLYNTNIYCVSAQPELSGLRDLGRFFSTYDALTDVQKRSLNDTIVPCLQ